VIEVIEEEVAHVRKVNQLPVARADWTKAEALADLHSLRELANPEVKAWAILYARYVLFPAGIEFSEICEALAAGERHCRRWQSHGIKRLTHALIHREWLARASDKRFRLAARLPVVPQKLFGREEWLGRARVVVHADSYPKLLVHGAEGTGKQTLVAALITEMIDADEIDQLMWIHDPPSPEAIYLLVHEAVAQEPSQRFELDRYLSEHHLVLVVHHPVRLLQDIDGFERLLKNLNRVTVIVISRQPILLAGFTGALPVPALDPQFMKALAAHWRRMFHQEDALSDMNLEKLVRKAGGSLVNLKWYIQGYGRLPQPSEYDTNADPLGEAFLELSPDAQQSLYSFMLMPPVSVSVESFSLLWDGMVSDAVLAELVAAQVVVHELETASVRLTERWREWLLGQYRESPENGDFRQALLSLLPSLDNAVKAGHTIAVRSVAYLLDSGWHDPGFDRRRLWLATGWRCRAADGHWTTWVQLLRAATAGEFADDALLWLGRSVCARAIFDWTDCLRSNEQAVELAGTQGDFLLQAEALLEQGISARMRGALAAAAQAFERVLMAAARYRATELDVRARIEQAQLALERGDAAALRSWLESCPSSTLVMLLKADAHLLSGEMNACLSLLRDIPSEALTLQEQARVRTLYARAARLQGDLAQSRREYEMAVTLLEQSEDLYGLARAYGNLAALLMEMKQPKTEIEELLERAATLQRYVGDTVASFTTGHNLTLARSSD
jgi:hypothetical protein